MNKKDLITANAEETGQWFLNDIQCLADIRVPVSEDKWA